MKKLLIVTLLAVASLSATAAGKYETIEALKARAASAQGGKQAELFAKVAERQLEIMATAFEQNNFSQAQSALADIVDYSVKAAETSQTTGKQMKKTEISLRQIGARLDDIRKTLSIDDRPALAAAIEKLERARTQLLHHMFKR